MSPFCLSGVGGYHWRDTEYGVTMVMLILTGGPSGAKYRWNTNISSTPLTPYIPSSLVLPDIAILNGPGPTTVAVATAHSYV